MVVIYTTFYFEILQQIDLIMQITQLKGAFNVNAVRKL